MKQNEAIQVPQEPSDILKQQKEVEFIKVNRFQTQQNAIFIDFQSEQLKKTIEDYSTLKFYHRLSLSKNISTIQDSCGDIKIIYGLLAQFAKDHQDIQRQLVEHMKSIVCKNQKRQDYNQYIIQPLHLLIKGQHLEIKQEASTLLTQAAQWMTKDEKKNIIKTAVQMSHNNDQQNKIVSIQLIAKMTPDLTKQQNQRFFLEDYSKMYNDSTVRVKKQIITELKVLGKNVSQQFFQTSIIQNFYLEKCLEKVWGVRKACVEIIPHLVMLTKNKKQSLANALLSFTKDGNKIVKVSAFKVIPQFLANYQSQKMPQKIMEIYIKLIDNQINNLANRQYEIISKVSFYFPGVLLRAGKKSWPQMKNLFQRLLKFKIEEVKQPIASSLHQISRIIGPQLSKQYMFSALDTILKEHSDSLKLNAIDHLSQFVQLFDTMTRQNLIDVFLVLQKDPKKWRVRYSIAHQLQELSKIYQTQTVFKYIFPISLKLCNDNVSQVRHQAAIQVYYVIQRLRQIQMFQQMAIQSVKGYGVSQKSVQRETFSKMVQTLCKLQGFMQKFKDVLCDISKDKVINVRIALAISIKKIICRQKSQYQKFQQIINQLKTNEQVAQYLQEQQ